MTATQLVLPLVEPVLIEGMTWREFKATEQLLARPGVRLSFLNGLLEICHLRGDEYTALTERIGTLLELYLVQSSLTWTAHAIPLESEARAVKREANQAYKLKSDRVQPDLVIEVVTTRGGMNPLTAYQMLQIPEVWLWEQGHLSIYVLDSQDYLEISESEQLPDLPIARLVQCLHLPDPTEAITTFQRFLEP